MKYHPALCGVLTTEGKPLLGPWQVGSLTGAVASESVTEACDGGLSADGNGARERNGRRGPDGEGDGPSRVERRP